MSHQEDLDDEGLLAMLLARPSTLPPFTYTFRGIEDESARQVMVDAMLPLADMMSRLYPLDGLDGITVAADYRQALAELDRGVETAKTIEPTDESFGTGFAMSSGVVRDGRMKTHVTFDASVIAGISNEDEELRRLCQHTFMHELGHVAEHSLDWARFGEAMLRPIDDRYEFELYRLTHNGWSEYYASRVSASWNEDALDGLRFLLAGSLDQMRARLDDAQRSGDKDAVASNIINGLSKVMKFAGYVIGHARGCDHEPLDEEGDIRAALVELGLADWFDDLGNTLDAIYDCRDDWTDLSAFYPLHRLFEEGCAGLKLQLLRSDKYAIGWRLWF